MHRLRGWVAFRPLGVEAQAPYSHSYRVYGLNFDLPFEIPGLPPAHGPPNVVVKEGEVPRRLDAHEAEGPNWDAEPGRFLLRGGPRADALERT